MALAYFEPHISFTWEELETITCREPHMATWPMAAAVLFAQRGYNLRVIELFDYQAFVDKGGQYLIDTFGAGPAKWMIDHSDIPAEQDRAKQMLGIVTVEKRTPTLADITSLVDDGYLIHTTVNSRRLNGQEGYVGHALLVVGYDEEHCIVNDPGSSKAGSQHKDRRVRFDDFMACWADPNDIALNILAFRKGVPAAK
jgi:hypothetical protein